MILLVWMAVVRRPAAEASTACRFVGVTARKRLIGCHRWRCSGLLPLAAKLWMGLLACTIVVRRPAADAAAVPT